MVVSPRLLGFHNVLWGSEILDLKPFPFLISRADKLYDFFCVLQKERRVLYDWHNAIFIIPRHDFRVKHEDFCRSTSVKISTSAEMIQRLSMSGIMCQITSEEKYISRKMRDFLERGRGEIIAELKRKEEMKTLTDTLYGTRLKEIPSHWDSVVFPKSKCTPEEQVFFAHLRSKKYVVYDWLTSTLEISFYGFDRCHHTASLSQEQFAKCIGENLYSAFELLMFLSFVGIDFTLKNWHEHISEKMYEQILDSSRATREKVA